MKIILKSRILYLLIGLGVGSFAALHLADSRIDFEKRLVWGFLGGELHLLKEAHQLIAKNDLHGASRDLGLALAENTMIVSLLLDKIAKQKTLTPDELKWLEISTRSRDSSLNYCKTNGLIILAPPDAKWLGKNHWIYEYGFEQRKYWNSLLDRPLK